MKKLVFWVVGLIGVGCLSYYAVNYYRPYQGIVTKADIAGAWKCTRSSEFSNGQMNIDYTFANNNTYTAMYKVTLFGERSRTYQIDTSGRYELLGNVIRTDVTSMEFIKKGLGEQDPNYRLLHDAFDPNSKDVTDYLVLALNKHDLVFTMDKTVKYTCSN